MLADPQSITVDSVAQSLPRTRQSATEAQYTEADGDFKLIVKQNQTAQRFRREVRIVQEKIAPDPFTAINALQGTSVYLVVDEPRNGTFTDAEVEDIVEALKGWLSTSNIGKLLGGEY